MYAKSGEEEIGMMISQKQLMAVLRAQSEVASAVDRVEEARTNRPTDEAQAARDGDGINLSDRAREVVRVTRALADMPEVREDLVRDIKERIEAGDYDIPAEDVAEKILSRTIVGDILRNDGPET